MKISDKKNVSFIRTILNVPHFTNKDIPDILANMTAIQEVEYDRFMKQPLKKKNSKANDTINPSFDM
jgi:hypothetical protein